MTNKTFLVEGLTLNLLQPIDGHPEDLSVEMRDMHGRQLFILQLSNNYVDTTAIKNMLVKFFRANKELHVTLLDHEIERVQFDYDSRMNTLALRKDRVVRQLGLAA